MILVFLFFHSIKAIKSHFTWIYKWKMKQYKKALLTCKENRCYPGEKQNVWNRVVNGRVNSADQEVDCNFPWIVCHEIFSMKEMCRVSKKFGKHWANTPMWPKWRFIRYTDEAETPAPLTHPKKNLQTIWMHIANPIKHSTNSNTRPY